VQGADFQRALSLLPVGFGFIDPDSTEILLANESAAVILEMDTAQDLVGKTVLQLVQGSRRDEVLDYLRRVAQPAPQPQFFLDRIQLASGRWIDIEVAGGIIELAGRSVIQVAFREITDRVHAETALRESEELFRRLTETTDAAIFLFRGVHYLHVNPAVCRITGYTSEELAAMPFWNLVHPDYKELVRNRGFARQQGHEVESNYEVAIITKAGETRWLQFAGNLIDYQGQPAVLGTAIDITARKEVEQALQQSEARFRTLTHVSPASISIHVDDRLIYANPATVSLTGYSVEELKAVDFWSILHPDSLKTMRQAYDLMHQGEAVSNLKLQIITKDGSIKWLEINWSPFDLSGKLAWVITSYDITTLVEAEQALRTYARRLEALSAIDRLGLMALSPQEIAAAALEVIRGLIPCDRASIAEIDAAHKSHILQAVSPSDGTSVGQGRRFKLSNWQTIQDSLAHGVLCVSDIDALAAPSALQRELRAEGIRSYINVPMSAQDKLVGVLNLGSREANAFDETQQAAALEVGRRLATVMHMAQLFEQLENSHQRLEELSRRLVTLQEAERRSIARELHDEVGQTLTALSIRLELASRPEAEDQAHHLAEIRGLVDDLTDRVRRMSLDLRPPMLDDLGLLPTLLWCFDRMAQQYQLRVIFEHHGIERRFDSEVETAVFRIVQEALTNVARHAQVSTACVRLWADFGTISAQIEDKGVGFDPQVVLSRNSSNGLSGMQERARLLKGKLVTDARPGAGACLTALLPLRRAHRTERGAESR
jgi:PAS domain S-box-containing protein